MNTKLILNVLQECHRLSAACKKKNPPIIANFFYHINVVYKVLYVNKYASTQKERNKTFYLNTNHLFQEC